MTAKRDAPASGCAAAPEAAPTPKPCLRVSRCPHRSPYAPAFFLSRFALALLFAPLAAGAQLRVQDASVLAGTCLNCHGPEGRSAGAIPSLRGHTAGYLLQRLQAFRTGQAPDATVMTRLMKGYDDAQVEALAHWFADKEGR